MGIHTASVLLLNYFHHRYLKVTQLYQTYVDVQNDVKQFFANLCRK